MSSTFQCWAIHEHCPHMSTPATANGVWRSAPTDSLLCEDRVRVGAHQRADVLEYDEPSLAPWGVPSHRRSTPDSGPIFGSISPATGFAGSEFRHVPQI